MLEQFFEQLNARRGNQASTTPHSGYVFMDVSNLAMAAMKAQAATNKFVVPGEYIDPLYQANTIVMDLPFVRFSILNTIAKNVKTFSRDYKNVVLCFDSAHGNGGYWRKDYAPYYKENRKVDREAEESSFPYDAYYAALNTVREELRENFPYIIMDVPRAEADDQIAILVKKLALDGTKCMIVSADGDFKPLQVYDNVKQWSPTLKKFVEVTKYEADLERITKIVKGDRKDNVSPMRCRSNYWLTRNETEKAPRVTLKFLESCVDAGDDGLRSLLTEAELKRFDENQRLIDFNFIDDAIYAQTVELFENYKPNHRSKIQPFLVSTANVKLLERLNDF